MKHVRLTGAVAIVLMLAVTLGLTAWGNWRKDQASVHSYEIPLTAAPNEENPTAGIEEDFTINENFSSHLPLIILDMGGQEPPITTTIAPEGERYVEIEGIDPYVWGSLSIIDSEDGQNCVTDEPAVQTPMRIKRRGNSSMHYEKAQYAIKLLTESGQDNDIDLLGMGAEHDWVLNGSSADKSMLRNYLAYRLSSQILPYTPDSRYCEVLFKTDDGYTYQGVYLLTESIKQGENRVDVEDFSSSEPFNSFLVRRDRYDESDDRILDVNVPEGSVTEHSSYFYSLYPGRTSMTEQQKCYIEDRLTEVEKVLYSEDEKVFETYPDYLDVDSFVDYFVINEYFGSYDAGQYSTYLYQDIGGKIAIGPVWDFDGAIDNASSAVLDTEVTAMQTKPWFEQLCKDKTFLEKVERRYIELRNGMLSDNNVDTLIEQIQAYLGGAIEREWMRWDSLYTQQHRFSLHNTEDDDGTVLIRETTRYDQEITRIRTTLRKHGDALPTRLGVLMKSVEYETGMAEYQGILLLLAALLFLIPAYYISYRK